MIHVSEPISNLKIIVTKLVMPDDPTDPISFFGQSEFKTVAELRRYFHENYAVAKSLGYVLKEKPDPAKYNERVVGRLAFQFTECYQTFRLEFLSVSDFVKFLKQHPLLAKVAEYRPAGRSQSTRG
jgi:hypothetical protein